MLLDWKLAAPADDGALVGLLSRWAVRGRQESPEPQVSSYSSANNCTFDVLMAAYVR